LTDIKFLKEAHLELTSYCNYKCSFCTNPFRLKEENGTLEWEFFKSIVDQCVEAGVTDVSLHGSGEPTLYKSKDEDGNVVRLHDAIAYCKENGLNVLINSNCFLLTKDEYEKIFKAGLDVLRVSFHGWDRQSYNKFMKNDGYDKVLADMQSIASWNEEWGTSTELHTTHLAYEYQDTPKDVQVEGYKAIVADVGSQGEVWAMHSWSGQMDSVHEMYRIRKIDEKSRRSCGRPFAPSIEIRANGMVSICCFDLGNPYYVGDLKKQTLEEVYFGEDYNLVRDVHTYEKWEKIPICDGCDQLYDFPDALVWTNIPGREYGQSKASKIMYIDTGEHNG